VKLPHGQVHNDWPDALHMHETAIFTLPLLNLTSPSSSIRIWWFVWRNNSD